MVPKESLNQRLSLQGLPTHQIRRRISEARGSFAYEASDVLMSLGVEEERSDKLVGGGFAYRRLPHIGAVIASFKDQRDAEQAVSHLGYYLAPNMEFSLFQDEDIEFPEGVTELPDKRWPLESGVEDAHSLNITGTGVILGLVDSGIDGDHIEHRESLREFRWVDEMGLGEEDQRAIDLHPRGHGTGMAGIISGKNRGVAPGVDLCAAGFGPSRSGNTVTLLRVVTALEWIAEVLDRPANWEKVGIVNLSLGHPDGDELDRDITETRSLMQQLAEGQQTLIVAAIGNTPGVNCFPANFPECLSVGAVDDDLTPAGFNGGGLSAVDNAVQPDIFGYGVGVLSSHRRNPRGVHRYRFYTGTSPASAYVAGIASLYSCCMPGLTLNDLRVRLLQTAVPIPGVGTGLARFISP